MQRIIMYIYTIYNIQIYTFVCTSDCAIALAMKFIVCNRGLKTNSYLQRYSIYIHEKALLFQYDTGISTEDNL